MQIFIFYGHKTSHFKFYVHVNEENNLNKIPKVYKAPEKVSNLGTISWDFHETALRVVEKWDTVERADQSKGNYNY